MNERFMRLRKGALGSIAFVVVLAVLAIVFRGPLVAWFRGDAVGGHEGKAVKTTAGPYALTAALDPDPPAQKDNVLVLVVADAAGKPVDEATVDVVWDMPAMGAMAEMKGNAKVAHDKGGRYRASFDLPMGGSWTLKTSIHAPQGDATQDFTMTVGSAGLGVGTGSGAGAAATAAAVSYPPVAFDALRSAIDAYDRARAALAADRTEGVADAARTTAEALRAAAAAAPKEAGARATAAAASADTLAAAASLDAARRAFADVNRDFLAVVGADARLVSGWRVFECGMFEGHPRWMQRADTPQNPYMGTKMPTCGTASAWGAAPAAEAASGAAGDIDHYTCPMHPSVHQAGPGKCPICGMTLVPVTRAQEEQGVVMIDEGRRQLIGVRTAPVTLGPMKSSFRAVGVVSYDESTLADVSLKVRGWITKLYVDRTGQRVARGQTLFDLYSPELYSAQQDFLVASGGAAASAGRRVEGLATAARQRLRLLGMSDAQIDALAKRGAPSESVAFPAPASGFVIEKNVVEGASVDAGARLYRIAALGKVWVEADVYEANLASVHVGQHADVTLDYVPGRAYDAKVAYVYPYLDPKSRTGRVRVELANKDLDLRPGMYANVALAADLGQRVRVPASAVVYTGPRRLVFVDVGEGRFRPQEITVGVESDGVYEVLGGVAPGDVVAVSGVFLIAAEARIGTAAKYWEAAPDAAAPAPTATPASPPPGPASTHAPHATAPRPTATPTASAAAPVYTCPMHPEVKSASPGKCPICGMDLVPKKEAP